MISQGVEKRLQELESVTVLIGGKKIRLVEALRNLPRSGKAYRIDYFHLDLPKRSLYDHILSLGFQADVVLTAAEQASFGQDLIDAITFHDLCEVFVGDDPDYTPATFGRKSFSSLEDKLKAESAANGKLSQQLPKIVQGPWKHVIGQLDDRGSMFFKLFHMIDKTDPIIAIWRYLRYFQGRLKIGKFLEAMDDFFTNPAVRAVCIDQRFLKIIKTLQDSDAAKRYYETGSFTDFADAEMHSILPKLIEDRTMHFVDETMN